MRSHLPTVILGMMSAALLCQPSQVLADPFFDDSELAQFFSMSQASACRERCTFGPTEPRQFTTGYRMERLELRELRGDVRQAYLVTKIGECGSAGCESAVLLREADRMVRIEERFGLDTDRAERIARQTLGIGFLDADRDRPVPVQAVTVAVILVVALCLLSAVVTRKAATGLTLWQRILVQSTAALVSTGGLYALGIVDELKLLAVPLAAGVTVTVVISVREMLS